MGKKQLVVAYFALLGQPVDISILRDIEQVSCIIFTLLFLSCSLSCLGTHMKARISIVIIVVLYYLYFSYIQTAPEEEEDEAR